MDATTAPIIDPSQLPTDVATLQTMIRDLLIQIDKKTAEYDRLKQHFDRTLRRFFGPKAERFKPNQPGLFDHLPDPEPFSVPPEPESPTPTPTKLEPPRRRCQPHGRRRIPLDWPREVRRSEPTEAEKLCPCCGIARIAIGVEASEQLEYVPSKMLAVRYERPKLACSACLNGKKPQNSGIAATDDVACDAPIIANEPPVVETAAAEAIEAEAEGSTQSNMSNEEPKPNAEPATSASPTPSPTPMSAATDPRRGDPSKYSPSELIYTVPMPPQPIAKGLAGPGLLAYVITSKYADHLPLHRMEAIIARMGVDISRSTMCDWMAQCADLLTPIYAWMLASVLESRCIHLDETRLPVQRPGKLKSGRLWVYSGDPEHPHICYDFRPDKSRAGPEEILRDYKGFVQADAANVFDQLYLPGDIVEVGCWAHTRRHFHDAMTTDAERAVQALARIQGFYAVERAAKEQIAAQELSGEAADAVFLQMRREKTVPLLQDFAAWIELERSRVLPKSPIGQAIAYAQKHWRALIRFTEHGFLEIDNNAAERSFRAVALGRRNYLFVGSDAGGETASVLYSLTQTCKLHKIDPFEYLRDVLTHYPVWMANNEPLETIARFTPHLWAKARRQQTPS